jgi:hypothetical protein
MEQVRADVRAGRPVRREVRAVRVALRQVARLVEEVEEPGAALVAQDRDRAAREQVEDQTPVAQEVAGRPGMDRQAVGPGAADRKEVPRAAPVRPAPVGPQAAAPPAAQVNTRQARSALTQRV